MPVVCHLVDQYVVTSRGRTNERWKKSEYQACDQIRYKGLEEPLQSTKKTGTTVATADRMTKTSYSWLGDGMRESAFKIRAGNSEFTRMSKVQGQSEDDFQVGMGEKGVGKEAWREPCKNYLRICLSNTARVVWLAKKWI